MDFQEMDFQEMDPVFTFQRDSVFQKLDSGFQCPVFRIPRAKISGILESGLPYMGRHNAHITNFPLNKGPGALCCLSSHLRPVKLFSTYQGQGGKTPSVTAHKIFEATHHDEVDGFEPHSFTYNVFGKIHNTHCTIMSLKYRIKVIDDVSLLIFFFNKVNFSYQYSFKMIYLYIFSYLQNYK